MGSPCVLPVMPERSDIISTIRNALEPRGDVLAVWLEGADGTGSVDECSDIDLCVSVTPGSAHTVGEAVRQALHAIGPLDVDVPRDDEPHKYRAYLHVDGASPYHVVDLNMYVGRGGGYYAGDPLERPLVLFDKIGLDLFLPVDPAVFDREARARREVLRGTIAMHARVRKYVVRRRFIEALGMYHAWVLSPLIESLRMRHTPLHTDWYIVHISKTLPARDLERLERLWQISSLDELDAKLSEAVAWFGEIVDG